MSCSFCDTPDLKNRMIYKDDLIWLFPTYIPIVPGHLLLTPARHVASITDLTYEELQAIFHILPSVKNALTKAFGATGFNYAWNEGRLAGQTVPHMHLHILPRKEGDTGLNDIDIRNYLYRTGERDVTPNEELEKVSKLVKENWLS